MTVACGLYSCFLPRSFHLTLYPIFSLGLVHSCILLVGRSLSPLPLCLSMSLPLPAPDPPSFHKGSLPSPGIHPSPVRSPPVYDRMATRTGATPSRFLNEVRLRERPTTRRVRTEPTPPRGSLSIGRRPGLRFRSAFDPSKTTPGTLPGDGTPSGVDPEGN